jgi:hypothetical protein
MAHYRQDTAMFTGLMDAVINDIVSKRSLFMHPALFNHYYSRLKVLNDQVFVHHSSRILIEVSSRIMK